MTTAIPNKLLEKKERIWQNLRACSAEEDEVAAVREDCGGKSGLRRAGRPAVKAGTALRYRRRWKVPQKQTAAKLRKWLFGKGEKAVQETTGVPEMVRV